MARFRWSRRRALIALAIAGCCAVGLMLLVGFAALDSGKGVLTAALLFGLGLIAALAVLFAGDGVAVGTGRRTAWLKPRPVAAIFLAIFAAFGTMTDALALFQPRAAVESDPGAIEKGVARIESTLAALPTGKAEPQARIKRVLGGTWGEPGCRVTYRFEIVGDALVMDSVARPAGTSAWHSEATILLARGDSIEARLEEPDRGGAVTFTYRTNGRAERLVWHDHSRPVPLQLDRCGKGAG